MQVSTEEGKHLATQFGCPFYETSAALRHYIDDAFYTLIREIRRKENRWVIKMINFNIIRFESLIYVFFIALGCLQQPSQCSSAEKIDSNRRSRWWRIRSILALVFRRRRRNN